MTVTPTDTTGTQAVTNSPANTTDNHSQNTTTDNRSTDNRTSDSHNTVDNSDRSDYSKVTNNTTNNYYQETKPSTEQQTGKPSGQETGQSSGAVLADVSDGQKGGLYSSGGKSLANGSNAPESAYMKATGQQETDEAPKEQENNFDIDLTDANIRIKANGSGGYDVVVRDAEKVTDENHETESTAAPFPVLDALQIGLLSAIFLCLIWDRKKTI